MNEKNLIKLAAFYVSDWHLTTMLLPYINKNLKEEVKVITILENDLYENIDTLVGKLNFEDKEKILDINWKKNIPLNYEKICSILEKRKNYQKICIIINGNEKYIENANILLNKIIDKEIIDGEIKIVNCFDVTRLVGKLDSVLDKHDKILNTSGEKEITDVYDNYIVNK
ncbi:MAG: hypothetical protein Q4G05_02755 [Clostridia bacterium]|nr:hypothetical protein [Clostridia bacterium]